MPSRSSRSSSAMTTVGPVSRNGSPSTEGVCATSARRPMAAPPCSAGDLERQLGRAAFVDETRDLVPVDDVRDYASYQDRDAELPELLGAPRVHANLFALPLDLGVDRFFHRSNSLTFLLGLSAEHPNRITGPHHGHREIPPRGYP